MQNFLLVFMARSGFCKISCFVKNNWTFKYSDNGTLVAQKVRINIERYECSLGTKCTCFSNTISTDYNIFIHTFLHATAEMSGVPFKCHGNRSNVILGVARSSMEVTILAEYYNGILIKCLELFI